MSQCLDTIRTSSASQEVIMRFRAMPYWFGGGGVMAKKNRSNSSRAEVGAINQEEA